MSRPQQPHPLRGARRIEPTNGYQPSSRPSAEDPNLELSWRLMDLSLLSETRMPAPPRSLSVAVDQAGRTTSNPQNSSDPTKPPDKVSRPGPGIAFVFTANTHHGHRNASCKTATASKPNIWASTNGMTSTPTELPRNVFKHDAGTGENFPFIFTANTIHHTAPGLPHSHETSSCETGATDTANVFISTDQPKLGFHIPRQPNGADTGLAFVFNANKFQSAASRGREYMKSRYGREGSAGNAVFNITELIEQIADHLSAKELYNTKCINRMSCSVITTSKEFRDRMWLCSSESRRDLRWRQNIRLLTTPCLTDGFEINPMLTKPPEGGSFIIDLAKDLNLDPSKVKWMSYGCSPSGQWCSGHWWSCRGPHLVIDLATPQAAKWFVEDSKFPGPFLRTHITEPVYYPQLHLSWPVSPAHSILGKAESSTRTPMLPIQKVQVEVRVLSTLPRMWIALARTIIMLEPTSNEWLEANESIPSVFRFRRDRSALPRGLRDVLSDEQVEYVLHSRRE